MSVPFRSVTLSTLLACLLLAAPAGAEVGGDCKLLAPQFGNPGLGCGKKGAACKIAGKAGTCTNMQRPIESLIYCVCLPAGGEVPEEVEAKAVSATRLAPQCGQTAKLTIDQGAPHIVDVVFPPSMGGAVRRIESFSGSFTVTTTAIPGDPNHCQIQVDSGQFVAASMTLPDGRDTGVNTYTFVPGAGSGSLDLTTGKYTAATRGTISNALYAAIPTSGTYRGTVDFASGSITIDTTTLDALGAAVPAAP